MCNDLAIEMTETISYTRNKSAFLIPKLEGQVPSHAERIHECGHFFRIFLGFKVSL